MQKRYAVINDETGRCVNVILWDGVSKWAPPAGHHVVQDDNAEIYIEPPAPVEAPPTEDKPIEDILG